MILSLADCAGKALPKCRGQLGLDPVLELDQRDIANQLMKISFWHRPTDPAQSYLYVALQYSQQIHLVAQCPPLHPENEKVDSG